MMARPKEIARRYIHTSVSHPVYDQIEHYLGDAQGKIPPGAMRDFIEACVEEFFEKQDRINGELRREASMNA